MKGHFRRKDAVSQRCAEEKQTRFDRLFSAFSLLHCVFASKWMALQTGASAESGNVPGTPQANPLDRFVVRRAGDVVCGNTRRNLLVNARFSFHTLKPTRDPRPRPSSPLRHRIQLQDPTPCAANSTTMRPGISANRGMKLLATHPDPGLQPAPCYTSHCAAAEASPLAGMKRIAARPGHRRSRWIAKTG